MTRLERIGGFLAMSAVFLIPLAAPFQSARAAETSCDFSAPLKNLRAVINDDTMGDRERLLKELGLRKQILKDVIHCAINEASSAKKNVEDTTPRMSAATNLKTRLLNRIDISLSYYDLKKSVIDNLGIQGTKDIANDLEAWRKGTELPLATQIATFLLWNQNQPLISATQSRFMQITHTLTGLDLLNNETIAKDLLDAKNQLAQVVDLNNQAETLIENGDSAGAMTNIVQSLETLKKAYQDFFSLSDSVQKVFTPTPMP